MRHQDEGNAQISGLAIPPVSGDAIIGERSRFQRVRLSELIEYNIYDLGEIPGQTVANTVTPGAYDARFAVGSITFEIRAAIDVDNVRGGLLASTVPDMLDTQSRTRIGAIFPIIQGKTTFVTLDLTGSMFPFFGFFTSSLAVAVGGVFVRVRAQEWITTERN